MTRKHGTTSDGSSRLRVDVLGAGPIAQAAHSEAVRKVRNRALHDLDAVVVAIADEFHVEATLRALDAGTYHRPLGPDGHFSRRQAEGFAATVLDGAPQQGTTEDDGLAALQLLEAIERSVETGRRVEIGPPSVVA